MCLVQNIPCLRELIPNKVLNVTTEKITNKMLNVIRKLKIKLHFVTELNKVKNMKNMKDIYLIY